MKGITIPHHGYPIALPPIELDPPLHLEEVLARLPDYRVADDAPVERYRGVTRGMSSLPVTFTPGPRRG